MNDDDRLSIALVEDTLVWVIDEIKTISKIRSEADQDIITSWKCDLTRALRLLRAAAFDMSANLDGASSDLRYFSKIFPDVLNKQEQDHLKECADTIDRVSNELRVIAKSKWAQENEKG